MCVSPMNYSEFKTETYIVTILQIEKTRTFFSLFLTYELAY